MREVQVYVALIKMTGQGAKGIKDLPMRVQKGREAVEKEGGKWLDWNFTIIEMKKIVKKFLSHYILRMN